MKNIMSHIDFFLDLLKRMLVRFKDNKDPNIIDGVNFHIKDDE